MPEPRTAENCPHRDSSDAESARCGIVADLLGAENPRLARVDVSLCDACCRSFVPGPDELNPPVASLLLSAASRIAEAGGVPGCDAGKARELAARAMDQLPFDFDVPRLTPDPASNGRCSLRALLPAPRRQSGPPVRRWAVGVTTAPRQSPTLDECLARLAQAGWPAPRLFIDGDVSLAADFQQLPQTRRNPQIGAWPSYYLGLAELLLREPDADAFLMLQDDALLCDDPDARGYLESVLWPGRAPGIASLFCSRADTQPQPGWAEFQGVWTWCALAFVFSRESAIRFLADENVVRHRFSQSRKPLADISWRVGRWAFDSRTPLYFPTPSLVQHIGEVSTLWQGVRAWGDRKAGWFAGYAPEPDFR
ncbi:MAG: hypothetical protein KF774_16600 [Planctomyces sp.]|nr:hypothetical protein [Planctomyces sp.]